MAYIYHPTLGLICVLHREFLALVLFRPALTVHGASGVGLVLFYTFANKLLFTTDQI